MRLRRSCSYLEGANRVTKKDEAPRRLRHSQTPIMVAQMRALKEMAQRGSEKATHANSTNVGAILTSNMLAGFALELGLKLFFMTFNESPPPNTHDLKALFATLPPQWRAEIDSAYQSDPRSKADYSVSGFQVSGAPPITPQEDVTTGSFGNAESFFDSVALIFVRSRYFFEQISETDWAFVSHPIGQMLAMADVLDAFYQHCLSEAKESA